MRYTSPIIEFKEHIMVNNIADLTSLTDNVIDTDPGNFGPTIK